MSLPGAEDGVIAREVQCVAPGVWTWQAYDPAIKCAMGSTAIETPDGLIIIDPIRLEEAALAQITRESRPHAVFATSGNHSRACAVYAQRYQIPLCVPAGAQDSFEGKADRILMEGDRLPGDAVMVGLPSAGPGEVSFVFGEVGVIGDAIINLPSHPFSLLPAKYCEAPARLPNELRKLLSYELRILTFAHGEPVLPNAAERLHQLFV